MVLQGYYAMGKTPIKHTLAGYIIKKTDTEGYRSGKLTGEKHLNKITEMMEFVGGRRKLIDQARFIENNTQAGRDGKIRINWIQVNSDIKKIDCDVSSIPEMCRLEGVEDSRAKQLRLIESVKQWKSEVGDCDWICRYYDDILGRLEAGKSVTEADEDMRFKCINSITRIKEPVWERVFSAKVFNDSKKFEKCYRQKMVSILTKYSPYYEKDMEDYDTEGEEDDAKEDKKKSGLEILKMHGIMSYAQTMEWKGPLSYRIDDTCVIDTSKQIYGTIINTQTLEHASPVSLAGCKKIMTIENKANYESMQYDENTLYIFCHGYFTPKEVHFLKKLSLIVSKECEFLHWGDMDFGGISIFLFIKDRIFEKLMPYRMGVADFEEALKKDAGIPLKASTKEKLEEKDAGLLTELKEAILESDKTIEQERLL